MRLSTLVRALCLSVLVLFATTATATPPDLASFARWAGADKNLDFSIERTDGAGLNGGFMPPGTYCGWAICVVVERPTLMIVAGTEVPDPIIRFVIAHELGHYEQWKRGYIDLDRLTIADLPALEQDADRRAEITVCQIGECQDGYDTFAYFHAHGYEGDDLHGTLAERIAAVARGEQQSHPKIEG